MRVSFPIRNAVKGPVEAHVMFMSSHNYGNYVTAAWKFYSGVEMICFHGNAQNTLKSFNFKTEQYLYVIQSVLDAERQ